MDPPSADTHLDSASLDSIAQDKLPELSRSQTTLDAPPSPGPEPSSLGLQRGKILRLRPDEVLDKQHAEPPSPLKIHVRQPELRPRGSKMSLFNLFSKPRVEKLRGHSEQGLNVPPGPPRAMSNSQAAGSNTSLATRAQNADAEQGRVRPTTSRSNRATRFISKDPSPHPLPNRTFDPPPLFQVWPQATKHATLETTTPEAVLQSKRSRTPTVLFAPGGDAAAVNAPGSRVSIESKMTVIPTIRHARSSSNLANMQLPTKLFVLTTSGYLLQYAEEGANDRTPERILRLGKESAAFASDLVPGKHFVLQVAHATDHKGVIVSNDSSSSLFSRFALRSQPRRNASSFLLVMSDAEEMGEWMKAIRHEIEAQGGKRARSDSSTSRPRTSKPPALPDLQKTPSVSHRYQIKRDPSGPSNVATPPAVQDLPSPPIVLPPPEELTPSGEPPVGEKEEEAIKKDDEATANRPRAASDTSVTSSTGLSVDQQQLDKLRNSTRMSRTSTVATSVTAASRTNSLSSSPCDPPKEIPEGASDAGRSLSTLAKRRSAAPLSLKDPPLPDPSSFVGLQVQPRYALEETLHSPVVGYHSPIPEPAPSPEHRMSIAQAATGSIEQGLKAESRLPMPMSTPAEERPQSFLADLPDPSTWSSKLSSGHRTSIVPFPPLLETAMTIDSQQHPRSPSSKTRTSPTSRPLRTNSNSFSLPLRVNPIEPASPRSPRSPKSPLEKRAGADEVLSPVPAVTTLEAKVDISSRTTIDPSFIPPRKSSTSGSPPRELPSSRRTSTTSARLSLFPSPIPVVPQTQSRNRSPSTTSTAMFATPSQPQVGAANGTRLARPASLQVRSDHAPFLASMRSVTPTPMPTSITTAPIRSLKPSRSAGNLLTYSQANQAQQARVVRRPEPMNFSINNRKGLAPAVIDKSFSSTSSGDLEEDDEATDQATPLIDPPLFSPNALIGSVARQSSRTRRVPKSRTSMPEMSMNANMDVIAMMGPPAAPPPSAPLPELPSFPPPSGPLPDVPKSKNDEQAQDVSRRDSYALPDLMMTPRKDRLSVIRAGTPIGVAIGDAFDEFVGPTKPETTETTTNVTATETSNLGLGIEITSRA